ncbi:MAG: glycosyltransferase family 2 protein [Gaiellaceae bacterium]
MKGERCTVIIPNIDGERYLHGCLEALRVQSMSDYCVILVDNGSTDGSLALVREEFPEVRVIELGENMGFAKAINHGIEAAGGEFVVLLNNDTRVASDWLEELLACLERRPAAAAAGSKTLLMCDESRVDGAGDVMDWTFLPHPRGHGERDGEHFDEELQTFSAAGAACAWRAAALRDIGLFDEDFFSYYEDVDLAFRARLLGYECWYAPKSVALHARGAWSAGRSEFTFFHPVKNRWFMILKNTPAPLFARHLHRIAFGEAYWWRQALRERKVRVVLRAYAAVARALPRVVRKRREVQARRRTSVREVDRALRPATAGVIHSARRTSDQ